MDYPSICRSFDDALMTTNDFHRACYERLEAGSENERRLAKLYTDPNAPRFFIG